MERAHYFKHEILILDHDPGEREALRALLETTGYKVVCVADEIALLNMAQQIKPACIFLDVTHRPAGGLVILECLRDYGAPVIVTSQHGDIPTAVQAIKAGAQDFIQMPFGPERIIADLEEIRKGLEGSVSIVPNANPLPFYHPGTTLTRREREVVEKLVSGFSNKEIASALGLSHRTVEDHRTNIMRKLGVRNAAQLMVAILNLNLTTSRLRKSCIKAVKERIRKTG